MTAAAAAGRRAQSWRSSPHHRAAVNDYARTRYQQQQAGTWAPFTSTAAVREHVEQLLEAGMTREQIARSSGVSVSTLTRAFHVDRMSTSAAAAVTSVEPPEQDPTHIPILTPARQLQALVADGWHLEQLAEACGLSEKTIERVVHESVTPAPRTAAAVTEMFERLKWEDPGDGASAVRSRRRAERRGWAAISARVEAPGSGDDDVDEVVVDRVVAGDPNSVPVHLRPEERQVALRRLAGTLPDDAIANRLGVATRTVLRHRASLGLPAYGAQPTPPPGVSRSAAFESP